MKAAVLDHFGASLALREMPDPALGTGEVIVDVVAAPVLPYMNEVLEGRRRYLLELPAVPGAGAVGQVRATGPDATRLTTGDWVFCDPTVRSRDGTGAPEITLQGLSARGPGGQKLQTYFRDGAFAERMRLPTENAIRLPQIAVTEAGRWTSLALLLVPYGGLLAGALMPGETVLISGATGHFGSAAVALALAMGAGIVVAPGRNAAMLAELTRRFGARVIPVPLSGDEDGDRIRMQAAAPGGIDLVVDILPPSVGPGPVRAAMMAVRPYGRVVLMGGVGMQGGEGLTLAYPWIMRNCITIRGQWMYDVTAPARLAALVTTGLLNLDLFEVDSFPLDQAVAAVDHAATMAPFRMTVICP